MFDLTPKQWVGFAIYLGYKSQYRRSEMERWGIDYLELVNELHTKGLLSGGKIIKNAREVFNQRFPKVLPSQIHQVLAELNLPYQPGLFLTHC